MVRGCSVEGDFIITGRKHSVKSSWEKSLSIEFRSLTTDRLNTPSLST